jgi:hypothetical protein
MILSQKTGVSFLTGNGYFQTRGGFFLTGNEVSRIRGVLALFLPDTFYSEEMKRRS